MGDTLLLMASAVLIGCLWLQWELFRQNSRILLRLGEWEKQSDRLALEGRRSDLLALDARAPDFNLSDLYAKRRTLADFRGQSLLLIFFNPSCSLCQELVPRLKALRIENRHLLPLIVSIGDVEQSRRFFAEHELWFSVLLQQESDVLSAYRVEATPSGYLIDAEGRIASELTVGPEPLLALAHQSFWHHSVSRRKVKRDNLKSTRRGYLFN